MRKLNVKQPSNSPKYVKKYNFKNLPTFQSNVKMEKETCWVVDSYLHYTKVDDHIFERANVENHFTVTLQQLYRLFSIASFIWS